MMKLWAATETITFDEVIESIADPVELKFSLSLDYFGTSCRSAGFAFEPNQVPTVIQVPALSRNSTIVVGDLTEEEINRGSRFTINSSLEISASVYNRPHLEEHLKKQTEKERVIFLGSLSCCGTWSSGNPAPPHQFYSCRIHRFESLCLDMTNPAFGLWCEASTYGQISADPDICSAVVLLAEIEILGKSQIR